MAKIAARYIGAHSVMLSPFGRPYYDGDGKQLSWLTLETGSTLMINDEELVGKTLFRGVQDDQPRELGLGKVILPEDVRLTVQELIAKGYLFFEGRHDFEIIPDKSQLPEGCIPLRPGSLWEAVEEPLREEVEQKQEKKAGRVKTGPLPEKQEGE